MLILAIAKVRTDDCNTNRHAFHDVGLALENLILQATSFGLFAHQIAGFNADKARELYQIPEDYEPATAVTIGYPGDPQSLPDGLRERELAPRVRKPLKEFVFSGQWGTVSPLLTD